MSTSAESRIAVVLPGGGARGAYEVGALSVLLPALERRGERVTIWCGTSVGAINATALASLAHEPPGVAAGQLEELWRGMRKRDVIAPLVGLGGLRTLWRVAGHTLGVPNVGPGGLLDPTPLAASLDRWIDWEALDRNVRDGNVAAACVVATSMLTGQPVGFTASRADVRGLSDDEVSYVPARLRGEHVRASAAIPIMFPTVEVTHPRRARGHYADGGTRLNSPIKPAIDLGADRVILVGLEPFRGAGGRTPAPRGPSIADVAANILDGLLVDQVAQDLRRLAAINSFFVEDAARGTLHSPRAYRIARGRAPYRPISYALVSPRRRGEIGRLAEGVLHRRYGGWGGLRDLDYLLMTQTLGRSTQARGELLSFLLFDPQFTDILIALGRRDARRWLLRHPRFWCRDAGHDLAFAAIDRTALRESEAIEEFRSATRPR